MKKATLELCLLVSSPLRCKPLNRPPRCVAESSKVHHLPRPVHALPKDSFLFTCKPGHIFGPKKAFLDIYFITDSSN